MTGLHSLVLACAVQLLLKSCSKEGGLSGIDVTCLCVLLRTSAFLFFPATLVARGHLLLYCWWLVA